VSPTAVDVVDKPHTEFGPTTDTQSASATHEHSLVAGAHTCVDAGLSPRHRSSATTTRVVDVDVDNDASSSSSTPTRAAAAATHVTPAVRSPDRHCCTAPLADTGYRHDDHSDTRHVYNSVGHAKRLHGVLDSGAGSPAS
jgi:hypothetical protein